MVNGLPYYVFIFHQCYQKDHIPLGSVLEIEYTTSFIRMTGLLESGRKTNFLGALFDSKGKGLAIVNSAIMPSSHHG